LEGDTLNIYLRMTSPEKAWTEEFKLVRQ